MPSVYNALLVPFVGLLIILLDYFKRRPTDLLQKRIFVLLIFSVMAAIVSEIVFFAANGSQGNIVFRIANLVSISLFFQLIAVYFSLILLLFEYTLNGVTRRYKRMCIAVLIINILQFAVLVQNFFTQIQFRIIDGNIYTRGSMYLLTFIMPVVLILIILSNIVFNRKNITSNTAALAFIAVLPVVAGSLMDLLLDGSMLILPSIFISILFFYLFIIRRNALTDYLTNVYNRRGFEEYLDSITRSRNRKDYTIILIDMDGFKRINDQFGHTEGDNALRDVGEILRNSVRRSDFVARYGGDEFAIIACAMKSEFIVENIRKAINDFNSKKIRKYTLAMSIGGDVYRSNDKRTPVEFVSYVDTLMYADKNKRHGSSKNA
ncbi:MAG: diguanylate cyclase [Defluviitaleaceae bacterium]|nr:diguanylate cyclase [Defluviitaleaceae bacterium]